MAKRAAAAEAESNARLAGAAEKAASADKTPAAPPAPPKPAGLADAKAFIAAQKRARG